MKKSALVLVASLLLGVTTACALPPSPETVPAVKTTQESTVETQAEASATPAIDSAREMVTLNLSLGSEPPTLDPALSSDMMSQLVIGQLFWGLTDYNDDQEVIPELATEWSVSQDGLVWTFQMRDDVPWVRWDPETEAVIQDLDEEGSPRIVNAHDVVYGITRTLRPETASRYAHVLYIIKGAFALNSAQASTPELLAGLGLRAIDDFTVEFTLETPAAYFPGIATMWVARPMPQWTIQEGGEDWVEPGNMVSNGPYVMSEWFRQDRITLIRNPLWPGWEEPGVGNIERVELVLVEEKATALNLYETNELDRAGFPLAAIDRVRSDPALSRELRVFPALVTVYLGFTMTKPPVDNALVRRALSAAIDRQTLIDSLFKGGELPAHTFAPEGIFGSWAHDESLGSWMLDYQKGRELAQQWMEEAGYPQGDGMSLTMMYTGFEDSKLFGDAIVAMWNEVFPMATFDTQGQEFMVFLQTISRDAPVEDAPHVWVLGWGADYADQNNWVHEVFSADEGKNLPRAVPGEFERLTKRAQVEPDPEVRKTLYREAEVLLVEEEARIAPLHYNINFYLVKPWLDMRYRALGGPRIDTWHIDCEAKKAATGG